MISRQRTCQLMTLWALIPCNYPMQCLKLALVPTATFVEKRPGGCRSLNVSYIADIWDSNRLI